jgi:hypothetical protein
MVGAGAAGATKAAAAAAANAGVAGGTAAAANAIGAAGVIAAANAGGAGGAGGGGGAGGAIVPPVLLLARQTFQAALTQIGFKADTIQAIQEQGFSTLKDLLDIADDQIHELVKQVGRWRNPNLPNVAFPFLCVQKLKAFKWWASL